MSKDDKIEVVFIGKGSYSDSKLNKTFKEGEKVLVNQEQISYLKKVKINGENVFKEEYKEEPKKEYSYKPKKESKKEKKVELDD